MQAHDALLGRPCNSEESNRQTVTFAWAWALGFHRMDRALRSRITSRLAQEPTPLPTAAPKPAAVLIPILAAPEPQVVLTQRSEHLSAHAGQICFPGGRQQGEDSDLVRTALREAEEEIGLDPTRVAIAGFLDPYSTVTGFTVLPVVGLIEDAGPFAPHAGEVADIFQVPLAFLLDPGNVEVARIERDGRTRDTYVFHYGERRIWGATAAIIVQLARKLSGA